MKAPVLSLLISFAAAATAWAGQPTSINFYPLEKLKPFVTFLGFDRDKEEMLGLQTRLQNSGVNWHCTSDAQHLRCPLNGDSAAPGTNVSFRAPHLGDNGATVSELHVTLLASDQTILTQLQPEVPAVSYLAQDWGSLVFAVGKPTNEYDDGSIVQHLYCATRELPSKPGEPHIARVYVMYINVSHNLNVVTSVELTVADQFLPPLAKPSC